VQASRRGNLPRPGRRRSRRRLTIGESKFGKSRLVPLRPTTVDACAATCSCGTGCTRSPPLLPCSSPAGIRLLYCYVHLTFRQLARQAGLRPQSAACRPRIHDLCHSFAVRSLLDAYNSGPVLSA
jgi:integrase/recombinase XerD